MFGYTYIVCPVKLYIQEYSAGLIPTSIPHIHDCFKVHSTN